MSNAKKILRKRLVKDNIDMKILGALILQKRKEAGLKAAELAKLVGISPQTLCGYEKGSWSVSCVNLIKLCLVFDCDFMAFKEAFKFSVQKSYVSRRVIVSQNLQREVREITLKEGV